MIPNRLHRLVSWPRLAALLLLTSLQVGTTSPASSATWFDTDDEQAIAQSAWQLLRTRCVSCHGAETQEAGLRLDHQQRLLEGGDRGPLLDADLASLESSLLWQVVTGSHDDVPQMPPEGEGTPLSPKELELLKDWMRLGMPLPKGTEENTGVTEHWAFQPVQPPALPDAASPNTPSDFENERNRIDRFVRSRLATEGYQQAAPSPLPTRLKRLSLDLKGLLPSNRMVARIAESNRPDRWERTVDRLLASPHFGERWARYWLDAARYADSDGYEKDRPRPNAWRYRDWVIDAINQDQNYRDFSIDQIAGDLRDRTSTDAITATGFHRNTLHNTEGGVDPEEDRVKKTVDRINTVGTLWLGLTVGCAQCHSHKYDPLTQREYYELYAWFNQLDEVNVPGPRLRDQIDHAQRLDAWQTQLDQLRQQLTQIETQLLELTQTTGASNDWCEWQDWWPLTAESNQPIQPTFNNDRTWKIPGSSQPAAEHTLQAKIDRESNVAAMRLEFLPSKPQGEQDSPTTTVPPMTISEVSLEVIRPDEPETKRMVIAQVFPSDWKSVIPVAQLEDGKPSTGWKLANSSQRQVLILELSEPVSLQPQDQLRFRLTTNVQPSDAPAGRLRLSWSGPASRWIDLPPVSDAVADPDVNAVESQEANLARLTHWDEDWRDISRKLAAHQGAEPQLNSALVQAVTERRERRPNFVHQRGDFLSPGVAVESSTPDCLPPLTETDATRLDFAQWLFHPEQPTTARVAANRIWSRLFGTGLVRTLDDFGRQGEPASHPLLLDDLAVRFGENWSRKRLIRDIVCSATYRQSSATRLELNQSDPDNRWLARQNRIRLEAEIIRDVALQSSGLLDDRVGGPSIKPRQPEGYSDLTYANSARWNVSPAGDAHRRGLYIFFQRTSPYPMLTTFDCGDANQAEVSRERSNTPLQALTLWNEAAFHECHLALAQRLVREADQADRDNRLQWMTKRGFELTLARSPNVAEQRALSQMLQRSREHLTKHPEQIQALVTGQTAAGNKTNHSIEEALAVMLARTLMNLDEFITRE